MLERGDQGPEVGKLHQILLENGFDIGLDLHDQFFGWDTANAVCMFQASHLDADGKPLKVDGIVGPKTEFALQHPSGLKQVQTLETLPQNQRAANAKTEVLLSTAMGEYKKNVHEEPDGSNRGERIDIYTGFVGKPTDRVGPPWCFQGDVEVLTERGWLAFADYRNECVAQVNRDDLTLSLVDPLAFIKKEHVGKLVAVNRRSLSLVSDSGHRFFGSWSRSGVQDHQGTPETNELFPVSDLATEQASLVSVPTCNGLDNRIDNTSYNDRNLKLLGAFVADGFFHRDQIEFQVSRPWKIDYLMSLEPNHHRQAPRAYGPRSKEPLTHVYFDVPPWFRGALVEEKALSPSFAWSLNRRQAGVLLDSIQFCDGETVGGSHRISQASKTRIDSMHMLATMAGWPAQTSDKGERGEFNSHMYGLTYEKKPRPTRIQSDQVEMFTGREMLYCVQVPSGLIMVRPRFGKAIIVGNCAYFVSFCAAAIPGGSPFGRMGNVNNIMAWAEKHNCALIPGAAQIKPGDIFIISRDYFHGHCGIVQASVPPYIWTVEGNCANRIDVRQRKIETLTKLVRCPG